MRRILLAGALALACIAFAALADVPTQAVGRVGGPPTTMAVTVQPADGGGVYNVNCVVGCSGSATGAPSIDGGFLTVGLADGGVVGIAPGQVIGLADGGHVVVDSLPANSSINEAQVGGNATAVGNGTTSTGTQRVTISSDSTGRVALAAGSASIGTVTLGAGSALAGNVGIDQTTPGTTNGVQVNAALPAGTNLLGKTGIDQTTVGTTNGVSVAQIGATTVSTGNGTSGAGNARVNIASDNTPFGVQPWDSTLGSAIGTAAHPIPQMVGTNPNAFSCYMNAATANTQLTNCGLSGASVSYYIDSVTFTTGAANNMGLVSSTTAGNACATSPTTVLPTFYFQNTTGGGGSPAIETPIKVTANSTLCCTVSVATASSCVVNGHTGP